MPPVNPAAVEQIVALHRAGNSLRFIANALTMAKVPMPRGGRWHPEAVRRVLVAAGAYRPTY